MEFFKLDEEMVDLLDNMTDEELRAFAEIEEEDIKSDAQVEQYIYICSLIFTRTGLVEYLERAMHTAEGWVAVTLEDDRDRARRCQILDATLAQRAEIIDLDTSQRITMLDEPWFLDPGMLDPSHSTMAQLDSVLDRMKNSPTMDDLEWAADKVERLLQQTPDFDIMRVTMLDSLSGILSLMFEQTKNFEYLEQAISRSEEALSQSSHMDDTMVAMLSYNIGHKLAQMHTETKDQSYLEKSIRWAEEAVNKVDSDFPSRTEWLKVLTARQRAKFDLTQDIEDLEAALSTAEGLLNSTPTSHPTRSDQLNELAYFYCDVYQQNGDPEALEKAVLRAEEAVRLTPPEHHHINITMTNLARALWFRYHLYYAMEDLERALHLGRKVFETTSVEDPLWVRRLGNLSGFLSAMYERTGTMDYLEESIAAAYIAMTTLPPDHEERWTVLNNLAHKLELKYHLSRDIDDLERSIQLSKEALTIIHSSHHYRGIASSMLGDRLAYKYDRTGDCADLDQAASYAEQGRAETADDYPALGLILIQLADISYRKWKLTNDKDHKRKAISYFTQCWNCSGAAMSLRLEAARAAGDLLAMESEWEASSSILTEAVESLPRLNVRSLDASDNQHVLEKIFGLAAIAAATALNAGKAVHSVLQILEQGRSVINGLLQEMRSDISDLKARFPKLAEEFILVRDQLDSQTGPGRREDFLNEIANSPQLQVNQRFQASQKFDEILRKIRSKPDFKRFLLPPTTEELIAAADKGPIVVLNINLYRCDAIIISDNEIRLKELPDLTTRDFVVRLGKLKTSGVTAEMLEWLWDACASPILNALKFQKASLDGDCPQVWWIPGSLSAFPIHAAGRHVRGSTDTVLDRVMSSYAPSVKTLIFGRKRDLERSTWVSQSPRPNDRESPTNASLEVNSESTAQALVINMSKTPGLPLGDLPFAAEEVEIVKRICQSLGLRLGKSLERKKEEVIKHLRACKIFHFAGHGQSNATEPSQSSLLLEDWQTNPLTVAHLRDYKFQDSGPFLGYLSACSTSATDVNKLAEEGVHLVSALQAAGFRHVIGTLWEVVDESCIDVARIVYETLRDDGVTDLSVCRGLHRAVRALRDKAINQGSRTSQKEGEGIRPAKLISSGTKSQYPWSYDWTPYIHFGV